MEKIYESKTFYKIKLYNEFPFDCIIIYFSFNYFSICVKDTVASRDWKSFIGYVCNFLFYDAFAPPKLSATLSDFMDLLPRPVPLHCCGKNRPTRVAKSGTAAHAGISTQPCTQDREQRLRQLPENRLGSPFERVFYRKLTSLLRMQQ